MQSLDGVKNLPQKNGRCHGDFAVEYDFWKYSNLYTNVKENYAEIGKNKPRYGKMGKSPQTRIKPR